MSSATYQTQRRGETAQAGNGRAPTTAQRDVSAAAHQAFWLLRIGFTVAPILFGIDKFFNVMVDWTKYLWPVLPSTLGVSAQTFMYGVGAIEIAAGVLVFFWPRIFAWFNECNSTGTFPRSG